MADNYFDRFDEEFADYKPEASAQGQAGVAAPQGQPNRPEPMSNRFDQFDEQFAGQYEVPSQYAPQDDYGWGITRSFLRGFESVASIPDVLTGDYDELAEHFQRQKELARTPEDQKLMEEFDTKGFWEAGGWLLTHPRMMAQMFVESAPNFLPPIFGAIAGGAGGAAAGSAVAPGAGTAAGATWGGRAGFGIGSFAGEYARSVTEYLGDQGYDVTDPDQLRAAMSDPEVSAGARKFAIQRGVPVAVAETLTFGLAGKFYTPIKEFMGNKVAGTVAGGAAETLAQATGGATGEAGAQLWSEGEISSPAQVMAEGLLEVPGAVIDPAVKYVTDPEFRASLKRDKGIENPDDSPLAALDRPYGQSEDESVDDTLGRLGEALSAELGEPIFPTLEEQRRAETEPMDPLDWQLQVLGETLDRDLAAEQAKVDDMDRMDRAAKEGERLRRQQEDAAYGAQEAQRASQEAVAYDQQTDQIVEESETAEAPPAESEMVTPRGAEFEQSPVDLIGGAPAEGMRTAGPEGALYETGGRPAGTPLADALRAAGVRRATQLPPDDEGPGGGGAAPLPPSAPPEAAPIPDARDTRVAEALAAEEAERQAREQEAGFDEEARLEREAIQQEQEAAPAEDELGDIDIPFTDEEMPLKPAVEWADERLADREYHGYLDQLISETEAGGGVTLVPDPNYIPGESDKRNDDGSYEIPMVRSSSVNPDWMQSIISNEGIGRNKIIAAVEKAKEGKNLGVRQKRIVQAMLDEIDARNQPEEDYIQPGTGGVPSLTEQAAAPEPQQGEQLDMMPEPTGIDAQATRDRQQQERERAAPEADMGVAGDLFTGTSAESRQAAEMRSRQTDVETGEIRFDVPEGTEFMDTAEAEKLADPNIPLPLLESQEGPYLDNLEKKIKTEGWKRPIQIVKTDKPYIYDGNHRLAVALRNDLPQVPVEWISEEEAQGVPIDATAAEERQELSEGEQESIDSGHVAYVEKLRASGNAANSLVADIEDQNEKWRIFRAYEEDDPWTSDLPQNEVDEQNVRIDRLADMGDERAMRLAEDMDHWMHDERIKVKSNDERYVKSRKQNKYGGITGVRNRNSISLDAAQLSATVDYDTLTFMTFEDRRRLDRILEVGERAERNAATPGKEATGEKAEAEANTHVDAEGNITFEIDEEQFNEVIDEYEHLAETPSKRERQAIDTPLKNGPFIPLKEAQKKVDEWAAHAAEQRKQPTYRKDVEGYADDDYGFNPMNNSQRIVISLFDYTGQWARPWAEAGYDVYTFDIKSGQDAMDFSIEWFANEYNFDKEIYAIIAAPPCTTFSNSGTRWRKSRHDAKSTEVVEEMWGKKAVEQGFEVPNDYGKELVAQTMRVINYFQPKVWALENPEGRIETETGLRGWRTAFQPHNFGDPYTKRTLLWGKFNEDMPTANVKPTEGSKMHKLSPSEERAALRSETPEGFSYAFFMANNYNDRPVEERLPLEFNQNAGAISEALRAGMTEIEIRNLVEDAYANEDYEVVDDLIREAIEGGPDTTPPEGGGAPLLNPEVEGQMTVDGFDLGHFSLSLKQLSPNRHQQMFWGHRAKTAEDDGYARTLSLVRVTFNRMYRNRPWYIVEARGDEEGFTQVAEVRQRPKNKDGLEWAVYVDGKEVDRWQDFAHAAGNVPGYSIEDADSKWPAKARKKFVEQKLGWRNNEKFSGVPPEVALIPQFEVEERDGELVKVGPKVEEEATPSLMDLANAVNPSGTGLAFNTRQKLKSMTVQELAKKHDQTDLQSYALRLDLDDKGNKIALAKRIKQAIESDVEVAAAEAAPDEATDAQKKAGNYKKGHLKKAGMDFTIENPAGTVRHGNLKLKDHYGYVKRTEGADGEQVDAFINPKMDEDFVGDVYIVDQYVDDIFDEHKIMFGYNNMIDARRAYKRNFNKDWTGDGAVTTMTLDQFKKWISTANTAMPAATSSVTEAGKKARDKKQKDLKFSVGKDMTNAPNMEFIKSVLKGDKQGDIPDTMPLNMVVSELLRTRETIAQMNQPKEPAPGTFIDNLLEEEAAADQNIVKPWSKADEKKLDQMVAKFNKEFPLANIFIGNRNDPAVKKDVGDALENLTQFEAALDNLQVPGFYDPNTGKIWIFRDRLAINLMDAKKLILHEMTHRGLDVMFDMHQDPKGLIEFNRLMGDIYDRAPAKHKAKLKRIESQYRLDSTVREDNYQAAEELVAMLAENNVQDNLVAKVIDFVRSFLERIGIITKEDAWTNEDIRALIAEAYGSLTGKQQMRQATIKEDVMLEDTGEVFEVETPAAEALTAVNQRIKMCQRVRACL